MWQPSTIQIYSWGCYSFYSWRIHGQHSYISQVINTIQETKCWTITVYVYLCFRCGEKCSYRWVEGTKYKRKANKFENTPWSLKQKRKGQSNINEQIKKFLYNCNTNQPQVMQSPIANYSLKLKIDGYTEPQLVQKL